MSRESIIGPVIASPVTPGVAIQLDCFVAPENRDSSQ